MTKIYDALRQAQTEARVIAEPIVPTIKAAARPSRPSTSEAATRFISLPPDPLLTLYSRIHAIWPDQSCPIIQLTSARPGEGVTTVAWNLVSITAERLGKRVLLIEQRNGEALRPSGAPIGNGKELISCYLQGEPLTDAIVETRQPGLSGCQLGTYSGDTNAAISTKDLTVMFEQLRGSFDFIVLDSPNVHGLSAAVNLTAVVDGSVLVIEAERTRWPLVDQARKVIEGAGGNVIGTVLNKRRTHIPHFLYKWL
jgi:Mrp family chromosome partitioning ATPase